MACTALFVAGVRRAIRFVAHVAHPVPNGIGVSFALGFSVFIVGVQYLVFAVGLGRGFGAGKFGIAIIVHHVLLFRRQGGLVCWRHAGAAMGAVGIFGAHQVLFVRGIFLVRTCDDRFCRAHFFGQGTRGLYVGIKDAFGPVLRFVDIAGFFFGKPARLVSFVVCHVLATDLCVALFFAPLDGL